MAPNTTNIVKILSEGDKMGNYTIRRVQPGAVVLMGPEGAAR